MNNGPWYLTAFDPGNDNDSELRRKEHAHGNVKGRMHPPVFLLQNSRGAIHPEVEILIKQVCVAYGQNRGIMQARDQKQYDPQEPPDLNDAKSQNGKQKEYLKETPTQISDLNGNDRFLWRIRQNRRQKQYPMLKQHSR